MGMTVLGKKGFFSLCEYCLSVLKTFPMPCRVQFVNVGYVCSATLLLQTHFEGLSTLAVVAFFPEEYWDIYRPMNVTFGVIHSDNTIRKPVFTRDCYLWRRSESQQISPPPSPFNIIPSDGVSLLLPVPFISRTSCSCIKMDSPTLQPRVVPYHRT